LAALSSTWERNAPAKGKILRGVVNVRDVNVTIESLPPFAIGALVRDSSGDMTSDPEGILLERTHNERVSNIEYRRVLVEV
jgi:hypothetical protein